MLKNMRFSILTYRFIDFGHNRNALSYWYYLHHGRHVINPSSQHDTIKKQKEMKDDHNKATKKKEEAKQINFGSHNYLLYWFCTK